MEITKELIESINAKEKYEFDDLLTIMELLRSEGGCPWDRAQTHESIRHNLLEETYEAVEAIDENDRELLLEELGDVLLQVVFHARISEEAGDFDIVDICDGVCRKLVRRHPHIFADEKRGSADEVLDRWEQIKVSEKKSQKCSDELERVAKTLPALSRAQKVAKKATAAGYELREVSDDAPIADKLFALCLQAQKEGIDAEEALRMKTNEYIESIKEKENET